MQKLRHGLANVAGADDQHLAPDKALAHAVIPFALHLTDQPRHDFTLVTEDVRQHVFGHDLTENTHGTGQAVVALQAAGQQRRDARPGRLQPLWLMPLTHQRGQQIRLAQPYRAIGRQSRQLRRVATGQHLQFRRGRLQQACVKGVVMFGNQNAHARNLFKTLPAAAVAG